MALVYLYTLFCVIAAVRVGYGVLSGLDFIVHFY